MKSGRGILAVILATSFFLTACETTVDNGQQTMEPSPSFTVQPSPSATLYPLSSLTPSSTVYRPSSTPIPCDPSNADYCIVDAYFVFQPPIAPPGIDSIDRSYPYGSTEGGKRDPHHGVEFYNGSGTPVLAAADGMVFYAGDDTTRKFSSLSGLYGNIVVLEHPLPGAPFDRLYTLYAHLSKTDVSNGQAVTAGEKIGEVGLTGAAIGSHLHFEVRIDPNDYASTLNPELWLVPHPGNGTLALFATDRAGTVIFPSFNVQYYPDRDRPATAATQVDAYALETVNARDPWNEIAALGDQPAGLYRITFLWAGVLYERWVEIQPGKLTRVMFIVN